MGGHFLVAGTSFLIATYAAYGAVQAWRVKDYRQGWFMMAGALPMLAIAVMSLSLGLADPAANFWNNTGFGQGWICTNAPVEARSCQQEPPVIVPRKAGTAG